MTLTEALVQSRYKYKDQYFDSWSEYREAVLLEAVRIIRASDRALVNVEDVTE